MVEVQNTRTTRLRCNNCGTPLTGRQTRWCSEHCAIIGRSHANRPAYSASQARWRQRRRAGLPPVLSLPEQVAYYRARLAEAERLVIERNPADA